MFKNLIKLTAILLILFLLPVTGAQASGKMEVKLGEKVTLQGDDVEPGSTYKWIVKKGKEIISTQTTPFFNYTFIDQGEYNVNLTLTNATGEIRTTSILVLAGDRYTRPTIEGVEEIPPEEMPLAVVYSTLPPMRQDGAVHLIGDGKVLFIIEVTRDDVLEYRIDRNIFKDSDGNGVANDDIDNANDDSYLLGGMWDTEYKAGEATKIVSEITLVTKDGEKAKAQTEILFDQADLTGDPVAILEMNPAPDPEDQLIHLYDDPSTVAFYSRASTGKISEYRIDKNVFVDSDGDGNPANDIDNLNDPSFKTGDVWQTEYSKTDDQIIAQLIVVGEGGKGSRVQRGIWFTDEPKPPSITEVAGMIRLTADKDFVVKGDPISFTAEGLTQTLDNYIFEWDFEGDGEADMEFEANNTVSYIYDFAGVYMASVKITDRDGNTAIFTKEIIVKDAVSTTADFDFEIEGNTVRFTNTSVANLKLANQSLDYTWGFADTDPLGYEEQKDQIGVADPTYTYNKAGTYIVSLTVTDADDVTDTKTSEILIEADLPPEQMIGAAVQEEEIIEGMPEAPKEGASLIVKILKILLYLILIVVVLIIVIFIGFLAVLKLQHPDLTFEELVDEVKIKILGMLGVHEIVGPVEPTGAPIEEPIEEPAEEEPIEGEVMEPEEKEPTEEAPLAKETGPVPDWMKESAPIPTEEAPAEEEPVSGTEIKEGEEVELPEEGEVTPDKQEGPKPDWLK